MTYTYVGPGGWSPQYGLLTPGDILDDKAQDLSDLKAAGYIKPAAAPAQPTAPKKE